jgi:hypothetical protein
MIYWNLTGDVTMYKKTVVLGIMLAAMAVLSCSCAQPTPLFNGRDLTGWKGAMDGYTVEDGKLVCLKETNFGRNLYTEREYSDFKLRFEFKLSPGANNGLGIRVPIEGNPAYDGMELQILDNSAEGYKDLRPYQFHGSIYGVVPAKQGHLKPVGQWNRQEVIADGPHITVKLNGATIVDADLEKVATPEILKSNKGLLRPTGYIALLGHDSRVEFRNITIVELNK